MLLFWVYNCAESVNITERVGIYDLQVKWIQKTNPQTFYHGYFTTHAAKVDITVQKVILKNSKTPKDRLIFFLWKHLNELFKLFVNTLLKLFELERDTTIINILLYNHGTDKMDELCGVNYVKIDQTNAIQCHIYNGLKFLLACSVETLHW